MVGESPDPAFLSRVDELHVACPFLALEKRRAATGTYLVLLEHHKVEVLNPLFPIIPHPFLHGRRTKDIPDVFINKRVPVRETKTHVNARNAVEAGKRTNLDRFSAARSPKPFFSVRTISIGAYCLRWNLVTV